MWSEGTAVGNRVVLRAAVAVWGFLCSSVSAEASGPASTGDANRILLTKPMTKCVVATYRMVGHEQRPATDVHCYFHLPQDEPGQQVLDLRLIPKPREITTDPHGRRLAHFVIPRLAPGQHVPVRWIARARTWATKTSTAASLRSPQHRITPSIEELYLADGPKYEIRSPYIRKLSASIAPKDKPPLARVRAIYQHLRENLRYSRGGGWDKAETVLRRGSGSCSEYTFAFVALCRAAGVPARYVGSTQCRRAAGPCFDRSHHRWGEAFIEGHGWVPVDVLKRSCVGPDYFYLANKYLILGHGDGGGDRPLGWHYTAAVKGKVRPRTDREFFWCDAVSPAQLDAVLAAAGLGETRGDRSAAEAGDALSALGSPLCIPFLTDVLYGADASAAARAARALCDLDVACARTIRYAARRVPRARGAMSAALEARSVGAARRPPGVWVDLFDGKRFLADEGGPGPFAVRDSQLRNDRGKGTAWTGYSTTDRCVIDLVFARAGSRQVALVFAAQGEGLSLKGLYVTPSLSANSHHSSNTTDIPLLTPPQQLCT